VRQATLFRSLSPLPGEDEKILDVKAVPAGPRRERNKTNQDSHDRRPLLGDQSEDLGICAEQRLSKIGLRSHDLVLLSFVFG
jgi:hypothetical protein